MTTYNSVSDNNINDSGLVWKKIFGPPVELNRIGIITLQPNMVSKVPSLKDMAMELVLSHILFSPVLWSQQVTC